jgi:hypothetical protein
MSAHIGSYIKVELAIFLHVNNDKSGCLGFESTIVRPQVGRGIDARIHTAVATVENWFQYQFSIGYLSGRFDCNWCLFPLRPEE